MARVPLEHTVALTCSYLDLGEARAKQILAMFTARSAAQSGPATSVQQERECSSTIEHALLKHRKLMQSDPTCTVVEMMLPVPLWHFSDRSCSTCEQGASRARFPQLRDWST
eukprot:5413-Heterococcus_DN1.PRE.3